MIAMNLRLAILGFGNVGQEFARLLLDRSDWLVREADIEVDVIAIATRSRGTLVTDDALDIHKILEHVKDDGKIDGYGTESVDLTPSELIESCGADILVELTTLNIESGQPAIDHISRAIKRGMHVITANKGPIAFAYEDLRALACSEGVQLRFEGTVMDGTPIFNLAEKTLRGCEIRGLEGILNSTSNYVLSEMTAGKSMDEAVRGAQERGIAEADPTLDLDGWDAAAKITALANVLMGARSSPDKVDRTGIRDLSDEYLTDVAKEGKKIRLIARAHKDEGGIKTTVRPERIDARSLYWNVDGTSSALTISTDLMGDVTIVESNPTTTQTAYAVFSDLLAIADSIVCEGK